MSPAGHWPQLEAAIEAGADSVYFGLKHFTARAKVGFELGELPAVFDRLHRRGVKGFVTFNTLIFEHELAAAAQALTAIADAGADAVIVQDLGTLQSIHQWAPELEIHASTQMSITNAEGVALAARLGAQRVTLARELSLEEIARIRSAVETELEIFVHGALCVAYSGQCLSSEAWGGRSANRGQCAQACRLPYELYVDGEYRPLGEARYLLSPGDLYALDQVPQIVATGVSALKIEGRYKDAEYVALTTRAYREAVDRAWTGQTGETPVEVRQQLEQVYSRGLGPFFLTGTDHQAVVRGRAPRHRGIKLGSVVRVLRNSVVVAIEPGLTPKPGDGLVFDAADWRSPQEPEEGGRVFSAEPLGAPGHFELQFANQAIDFSRIRAGDLVWRSHDPAIDRAAKPYREAKTPVHRQRVDVDAEARPGEPLRCRWTLAADPRVAVETVSAAVLDTASERPLSEETLREYLGRLGATAYELGDVRLSRAGLPFAPASMLNAMRREAVEQLEARQAERRPIRVDRQLRGEQMRPAELPPPGVRVADASLHVLVRTKEQLQAAIAIRPASITLDYLDLYGLRPSVDLVKGEGLAVRVASPRVLKPGEEKIADFLARLDCPLLVRAAGLIPVLRERTAQPLTGDFSLNAANSLTASALFDLGLTRLTPAHDLNAEQIATLARAGDSRRFEVVAYQHLPVFHTEHCVFCRFLSTGTSYRDCGRPCELHQIAIQDPAGRAHPVMADVGCRNTVFGAEAQQAAAHLERWLSAGIAHYRVEFVHESPDQVTAVAQAFRRALDGELPAAALARHLQTVAPGGITEGSLFVPQDYLSLPVLP